MTATHTDARLSLRHLLVPVTLLSLTMFAMIAFQTLQIMRDRDALNISKGQQEQAFQESQRLQGQLNALLGGTQKLAVEGNKNARDIVEKLKSIGVQLAPPAGAPAPGASMQSAAPGQPSHPAQAAPVTQPDGTTLAPVPAAMEAAEPAANPVKP